MISILLGVLILFVCFYWGRRCLLRAAQAWDDDEIIVYGTALGLGLLSFLVLLLGLANMLFMPLVSALLLAPAICPARHLRDSFGTLARGFRLWHIPFSLFNGALYFGAGLTGVCVLAGLLAPETANDSLCYHINLPKIYLETNRIGPIAYDINSTFPGFMEMLFTLGLGLGGDTLAKFFHVSTALFLAGAVLLWGRRAGKLENAWQAAILLVTVPGLVNQWPSTYIDGAMTAFTALLLVSLISWFESSKTRYIILAGVFAGFLMSMKFLALISLIAVTASILWHLIKNKRNPGPLFLFGFIALAICAYWYIRSYLATGNPVYPYFYSVFKAGDGTITYDDIGLPKTFLHLLSVPWMITMRPDKFEGFGVQIGPAFLAFLPGIFWLRKDRTVRFLASFALIYAVLWFFLGQSLRFLFPFLPALAMLLASVFGFFSAGRSRAGFRLIVLFILAVHTVLAVYHYRGDFLHVVKLESTETYLRTRERSFGPAQFSGTLPANAKILAADETHLYHFQRPIVRESVYGLVTKYYEKMGSSAEVLNHFKEQGFTHILLTVSPHSGPVGKLEAFRVPKIIRQSENHLADYLELLYSNAFKSPDGLEITYYFYRIR